MINKKYQRKDKVPTFLRLIFPLTILTFTLPFLQATKALLAFRIEGESWIESFITWGQQFSDGVISTRIIKVKMETKNEF